MSRKITQKELDQGLVDDLVLQSEKGAPNGVPSLDSSSKIPISQIPLLGGANIGSSVITNEKMSGDIKIGSLATLNTSSKTSVTDAINELFTNVSNGKSQIATAITDKGMVANENDTFNDLAAKINQLTMSIDGEVVYKRKTTETLKVGDRIVLNKGSVKDGLFLSNDIGYTSGSTNVTAKFSPTGKYMFVYLETSLVNEKNLVFKRNGESYIKISVPKSLSEFQTTNVAMSEDESYVVFVSNSDPTNRMMIYTVTNDEFVLVQPSSSQVSTCNGVAISSDGSYIFVAGNSSEKVTVYARRNNQFIKLPIPSYLPPGNCNDVSCTKDGVYVCIAHFSTPFITIYKRDGDVLTKLNTPSVIPPGNTHACAFSNNGEILAIGGSNSPFIRIYRRTGDTFTEIANNGVSLLNFVSDIKFLPDDSALFIAHSGNSACAVYTFDGQNFLSTNPFDVLPARYGEDISIIRDMSLIAVSSYYSPYISFYRTGEIVSKSAGEKNSQGKLGYSKGNYPKDSLADVAILFK